ALCGAGEARPRLGRGGGRPGIAAAADLLVHHPSPLSAGRLRRQPSRLRPRHRGIPDPAAPGRRGQPDDRPGALGFLLRRARLADRLGGDGRPRPSAPAAPLIHRPGQEAGGGDRGMSRAALLRRWLLRAVLVAGLAFFYAPIVSVVLFSFNASTSAAVWS